MDTELLALIGADALLLAHVLFVCFVIGGLGLVILGKFLGWSWILNPWFRVMHLAAIAVVVVQSWFGLICPLTTWEMMLRKHAGDTVYAGTFISHWLDAILYYQAPPWVFALVYTVFGTAVVLSWVWIRPRPFGRSES